MSPQIITFKTNRQYSQPIVGESHYQNALKKLVKTYPARFIDRVELHLQDDNKYDSNAVAVLVDDKTIGYLSREDALKYRRHLEALGHPNAVGVCAGKLIGGGAGRSYGFILDLDLQNLQIDGHYTLPDLPPKTQNPSTAKKLLIGCLITFGILCIIFVCTAALGGILEAVNGTPTAQSLVTFSSSPLTSPQPAQPPQTDKTPEEYLAEYGGRLEIYQNILSLTDCALLQEQFDQASANNARETPGTPQFQWTLGYMRAADERMQNLGCY